MNNPWQNKLEVTEKANQLATLEAKNSSLDAQIADHLKQLQESASALADAEASLKPFQELGKTPDEIKKDLMKRPVTLSQPLPPRPASQAGKITEPIQTPEPEPKPSKTAPEPKPEPEPDGEDEDPREALFNHAVNSKWVITEMTSHTAGLESIFRTLTTEEK